tara:strand:+ start:69 stop:866 length:798 start_codon:yes stop_codon:yes gene_type:complete
MKNKEILFKDHGIKIHPQMKVIGMLYVSDYRKIELAKGQRPLTPSGLKNIGDSMHKHGVLTSGIAVRNPNKKGHYIIPDGQTRMHEAKKNNLDMVFSLVDPDCSINDLMIILNTSQHNWNAEAYLNNGIEVHNNMDMRFLETVYEDTGLSLTALYQIYANDLSAAKAQDSFEKGTWVASTKSLGNRVIKYAEELNDCMPFSLKARFLQGFVVCVNKSGYSNKQMLSQAKRFPAHIHTCDTPTEYKNMLNHLYNHCCVEEDQLYLA